MYIQSIAMIIPESLCDFGIDFVLHRSVSTSEHTYRSRHKMLSGKCDRWVFNISVIGHLVHWQCNAKFEPRRRKIEYSDVPLYIPGYIAGHFTKFTKFSKRGYKGIQIPLEFSFKLRISLQNFPKFRRWGYIPEGIYTGTSLYAQLRCPQRYILEIQ